MKIAQVRTLPYTFWFHSLMVRTQDSDSCNLGSIPSETKFYALIAQLVERGPYRLFLCTRDRSREIETHLEQSARIAQW
jgi:hypothetical protein